MGKFMNLGDMLVIALSAYVVVWGINSALRAANLSTFQA